MKAPKAQPNGELPVELEDELRATILRQFAELEDIFSSWDGTARQLNTGAQKIDTESKALKDFLGTDEAQTGNTKFMGISAMAISIVNGISISAATQEERERLKGAIGELFAKGLLERQHLQNGGCVEVQRLLTEMPASAVQQSAVRPISPPGTRGTSADPHANTQWAIPTGGLPPPPAPPGGKVQVPASAAPLSRAQQIGPTVSVPTSPPPTIEVGGKPHPVLVDPSDAPTLVPPASTNPPAPTTPVSPTEPPVSSGASIQAEETKEADPDGTFVPVIFFTNEKGEPISDLTPLFARSSAGGSEEYVFKIGRSQWCDIQITEETHPNGYFNVSDEHGEIKIADGTVWVKSSTGGALKSRRSNSMFLASQWTKLDAGDQISLMPKRAPGAQPASIRDIRGAVFIEVEPEYPVGKEDANTKHELSTALRKRVKQLLEERDRISKEDPDGPNCIMALHTSTLLREALEFDLKHQLGALSPQLQSVILDHFSTYRRSAQAVIAEIYRQVFEIQRLQTSLQQKEEEDAQFKQRKEEKLSERAVAEGVDVLHLAEDEDPEDREITVVFRRPAYKLWRSGENNVDPDPFLVPKISFGSHKVCLRELKPRATDKKDKRVAPFMAKLQYEENGQGAYEFEVRMLHTNVRLQGGKVHPGSEKFKVQPGEVVSLGNYFLTVGEETHGYSYKAAKDMLFADPTEEKVQIGQRKGILVELFERIENQDVTTSEQDEEAHAFICEILETIVQSKIPEEEKLAVVQFCRDRYAHIENKLWSEVALWGDAEHEEMAPDSGHFQTLQLLVAARENRIFTYGQDEIEKKEDEYFRPVFSETELEHKAEGRIRRYVEAIKAKKPGRLVQRMQRAKKNRKRVEEYQEEQAIGKMGIVEIARFLEMGLVDEERLKQLGAPASYVSQIKKVGEIREKFSHLQDEDRAELDDLLELHKTCGERGMEEIFAPEEIHTRNLHIEVNMEGTDPAREYVRKVAVFAARLAFNKLNELDMAPEEILKNTKLIEGLVEARIISHMNIIEGQPAIKVEQSDEEEERRDGVHRFAHAVRRIVGTKETEADTVRKARSESRQAKRLEEDEINRLVQYAAAVHSALLQARRGITFEAFLAMLQIAPVALHEGIQQLMSREDYDISIDEKECVVGGSRAAATATKINWKHYFQEWEKKFGQLAAHFAQLVCQGDKEADKYVPVLENAVAKRVLTYEKMGITEQSLMAGVQMSRILHRNPLYDFSYLTIEAGSPQEEGFWENVKDRVTKAKLQGMVDEFRKDDAKKLFYKRKIRVLQRKYSRAKEILIDLQLSEEECDLLQLGE